MTIEQEISEFGRNLMKSVVVKEVDIRIKLTDNVKILWSDFKENENR